MKRKPSIRWTPHPKVLRHIDALVKCGLYGRSRTDVVKRLVCAELVRVIGHPRFPLRGGGQ